MSRNDSNNRSPGDNDDDERNPFVAFRRFADDQIDTAFRGLGNISSIFGDVWKTFDEAEREARMKWKKFEDHYERAMNPERKRLEGKDDDGHIQPEKGLRARYREVQESVAAERLRRSLRDDMVAERAEQESTDELFGLHPYSPNVLEFQGTDGQSAKNWRIAFEDLMRAQNGLSLTDSSRQKAIQDADFNEWSASLTRQRLGSDGFFTADGLWSHGLVWRALQDARLLRFAVDDYDKQFGMKYGARQEQESSNTETELDMYEQFLGRQARSRSSTPPEASSSALGSSSHAQNEKRPLETRDNPVSGTLPSVVATMTTTERHMQSDGTVTTKTVLKKKFSDGTEHSEESTNTAQVPIHELKWPDASAWLVGGGRGQQGQQNNQHNATAIAATTGQDKPKKKEGSWFWSS